MDHFGAVFKLNLTEKNEDAIARGGGNCLLCIASSCLILAMIGMLSVMWREPKSRSVRRIHTRPAEIRPLPPTAEFSWGKNWAEMRGTAERAAWRRMPRVIYRARQKK